MNNPFKEISTKELFNSINKNNIKIIDIRSVTAYNGWQLKNEKRGGHILGAKSLPIKWSNYIDWIEIVRSKHILPENSLVIYSYSIVDSEKVALLFQKAGYKNIKIYNHFVEEWSANKEYPMDKLARYKQLVSAEWVKDLIDEKSPQEYSNNKFVICCTIIYLYFRV